jgi:hypothetical protein
MFYLGTSEDIFISREGKLVHLNYDLDLQGNYFIELK